LNIEYLWKSLLPAIGFAFRRGGRVAPLIHTCPPSRAVLNALRPFVACPPSASPSGEAGGARSGEAGG